MSREAMKLALDMLNEIADDVYCDQKLEEVITALRQALETEREWVGLTDEEIDECERLATIRHQRHKYSARGQLITPADGLEWHFAGAIEAKLKEKNT